jgi:hypothetical protein
MALSTTNLKEITLSDSKSTEISVNTEPVSISISPIPPKSGKLKDYPVYYKDTDENSKFFAVSRFPEKLKSGKNFFLITGTDLLTPTTPVLIEVLDVNGNELDVKIPNILVNGTDRMIVINIKSTDYYGKGIITILGQAQDVPKEWKNAYNVRWQKEIIINPSLYNDGEVIFENDPKIYFTEDYDETQVISNEKYTEVNYRQGLIYSKIGKSFLVPAQFSYMIYLQDGPLLTQNALFDGLTGWDTSSTYISDVTASDSKLYFSQSYGMFGITEGVTQDFSMSANVIYTLNAEFKGSESELGSSVASVAVYAGSNLYTYLYTTASTDITLASQFSSSTDTVATIELSGQAFAVNTVWSNVYVANLISGSNGNGFSTAMEGAKLTVSASDMTVYPNTDLYEVSGTYTTYIYKIINPETAIVNNSYQAYNLQTKNFQRVAFISASYNINYNKLEYVERENIRNSYLELFFKDLSTHVGNLKFVDVYKNPGKIYVGRYDVQSYNFFLDGNDFTDLQDFTDNWTSGGTGSYANLTGGGGSRTKTQEQQEQDEAAD